MLVNGLGFPTRISFTYNINLVSCFRICLLPCCYLEDSRQFMHLLLSFNGLIVQEEKSEHCVL